ncbi:mitochondrial contact site and cristae organizing system subunit 10 [Phyllostomus discolor]|uniref:MICOS complex subunit MIC10 n=1 Tax=Phyllostomus discolor TaxID=89673 RepID=A0A834E6Y8_9CHIR|nr:mitochondrial contact site and cristae organizing system subunit 10 [Phyllostomus discolor]
MSDSELGRKWDRCLADTVVKIGTGLGLGLVFSLTFFKSKCDSYHLSNMMSCCTHTAGALLEGAAAWLPAQPRMGAGSWAEDVGSAEVGWVEHLQNSPGAYLKYDVIENARPLCP